MIKEIDSLPTILESVQPSVSTLFYQGDLSLLHSLKIAIVGTRRPSTYTKSITFALAQALKDAGAVVVSGAAMGVDAQAHKGAYPKTIAVMANSLDIQAPSINKGLIESMSQEALCLSEYPVSTHPTAYSFVQRNRIVIGLSDVVVLAEADIKSGTMHSANFALKFNKPIFVLAHRMGESLGTQKLVKEGKATVIYSIDDFIKQLSLKAKPQESDELLAFCQSQPSYDETVAKFPEKLFEYELLGKVEVVDGRVRVIT
jgi:DNA processing protein